MSRLSFFDFSDGFDADTHVCSYVRWSLCCEWFSLWRMFVDAFARFVFALLGVRNVCVLTFGICPCDVLRAWMHVRPPARCYRVTSVRLRAGRWLETECSVADCCYVFGDGSGCGFARQSLVSCRFWR